MEFNFFWNIIYRMPRKSKITAAPIEPSEYPQEGLDVARHALVEKTDAEEMTDFINKLNVADETPEAPPQESKGTEARGASPLPEVPEVAAKAKAKRASRAKPKDEPKEELEEEPEVEVTSSSLDEVQAEVTIPEEAKTVLTQSLPEGSQTKGQVTDQREAKADAKVTCPDCGKQMSAKTLKYSHVPNCPTKKRTDEKDTLTTPLLRRESVLEEVIENEVQKRLQNKRSERAARREEMVHNLMKNAF